MQISMRKICYLFFLVTTTSFCQFEEIGQVAEDLLLLADRYITPSAEGADYQVSGGWYTSAKKKNLWELDFSVQGNLLFIPSKFTTFSFNENELQNLSIEGGMSQAEIPTALGNDDTVVLQGSILGSAFEFDTPEGLGRSTMPHANLQASLGIWAGTTVAIRYSPKITIDKTKLQHLGVGIQHNISQWILDEDSSFEIAAAGSYTLYDIDSEFKPLDFTLGTLDTIDVDGNTILFSVFGSKKVSNFDFSAGLGVTSTKINYTLGGDNESVIELLNDLTESLSKTKTNFRGELSAVYELNDFSVSTMLLLGKFTHATLGVNYKINLQKEH